MHAFLHCCTRNAGGQDLALWLRFGALAAFLTCRTTLAPARAQGIGGIARRRKKASHPLLRRRQARKAPGRHKRFEQRTPPPHGSTEHTGRTHHLATAATSCDFLQLAGINGPQPVYDGCMLLLT